MAKLLIDDILKLNISSASVKKINLFLSTEPKYSDDYMKATSYLAIMMHELKNTTEALKLLYSYVPNLKEMSYVGIIALCDGIIYITLEIKRYDQAEKYIKLKKDFLPVSKSSLYQKDLINLLLHQEKYNEAKEALEKYVREDISKDEKMEYLSILINLYFENKEFDIYKEKSKQLINYYKSNFRYKEIDEIEKKLLLIIYEEKDYVTFIANANKALEAYDDNEDILEISSLLIFSYLELNDTRRASIIESSYSELANEITSKNSLSFCNAAKKLYDILGNILGSRLYSNRIEEINNTLNTSPKDNNKKKEEYNIPNVEIKANDVIKPKSLISNITNININKTENNSFIESKTTVITKPKNKVVNYKNVLISDFYNQFSNLINEVCKIDLNVKFREYFRNIMPKICEKFDLNEAYILYFKDHFIGHHYKMNRVYDKYPKEEELNGSLLYFSYINETEGFFDKTNKENNLNIINSKSYTDEYLYTIPLYSQNGCIGSIQYLSLNPFLDVDLNYEALKIITNIINENLNLYLNLTETEENYYKESFIIKNMPYGIKEEKDNIVYLSDSLVKKYDLISKMELNDYYSHLNNYDLSNYKNIKEYVSSNIGTKKEFEYDFSLKDKIIRFKETMYSIIIDNILNIISIIEDVTNYKNDKELLKNLAYKNPISKLNTELKLLTDIAKLQNKDKFALAIIYVDDFKIYKELYGYNFEYQLIYKLGDVLTDVIKDEFKMNLYHLNNGNFAILIEDENDKRIINLKIKNILDKAKIEIDNVNKRLNINFVCGIYRALKGNEIKNITDYISMAGDASYEALNEIYYPKIAFYDNKTAKCRFEDNALVTHISESIDAGLLRLTYKQIVNLNEYTVLGYKLGLNLVNLEIEEDKIYEVIKRRNLKSKINDYIINNLFKEEKMFYNKTHGFLNIYINLSLDDLTNRFITFIKKELDYYKIKPEFICFIFDDLNDLRVEQLKKYGFSVSSTNLIDLYHQRCDYLFLNYLENKDIIDKIYNLSKEYNAKLILTDINNEDDIKYVKEKKYEYIVGNYYKRLFKIEEILKKVG